MKIHHILYITQLGQRVKIMVNGQWFATKVRAPPGSSAQRRPDRREAQAAVQVVSDLGDEVRPHRGGFCRVARALGLVGQLVHDRLLLVLRVQVWDVAGAQKVVQIHEKLLVVDLFKRRLT